MHDDVKEQLRHPKSEAVTEDRDRRTEVVDRLGRDLGHSGHRCSWIAHTRKKLGGLVAYSVTWHRTAAK
jgi:hypothetical protein